MSDRKTGGAAAARRKNKRPLHLPGGNNSAASPSNPDRDGREPSGGDTQLSNDVAREHQAQLNQLRDEPVPSSHYDDRHRQTDKQQDAGEE